MNYTEKMFDISGRIVILTGAITQTYNDARSKIKLIDSPLSVFTVTFKQNIAAIR